MGVIGLSVVSYGVFDAVNKQQQVSDIPVATESGQEDPPIEILNKQSQLLRKTLRLYRLNFL